MSDPEGAGSPPEAPAGSRRPSAVVAMVVIAVIVSGAVSAGVTLAVLRLNSRTNPQTVDLGSNVRITENSAIIDVVDKAAPAVATIVTGQPGHGLGSGYLLTTDGYIVTNAHVVANATGLSVIFAGDPNRHNARLVDSDCQTDIAVLKVDGVANMPTLPFGDVGALRPGVSVIAVGSPYGQRSVGAGIVSSLHRTITAGDPVSPAADRTFADTIRTTVVVDPVSSGGPLLNVAGQVIGVTVAADSAGGVQTFALSVADVRPEVEQMVRDGKLVLPYLGITSGNITSQDAALQASPVGASVTAIAPGGPAESAGLKNGDVIIALDEVKLDDAHPLVQILDNQFRPGQRVTLTLFREGTTTQVQATLGSQHPTCG